MYRLFLLLALTISLPVCAQPRALVIVVDGLRPDYATPDIMPRLAALRDAGFSGEQHHAVFPTVTRVNAPSIATGAYPQTHGLMGNAMYVPEANAEQVLSTGEKASLDLMEAAYQGALLTAPTLGQILTHNGRKLFAASSGSSGSGYLMNYRPGSGGMVHMDFVLPDTLEATVTARIGIAPEEVERPFAKRVRWAIDAVLEIGIDYLHADALMLWVTEPDGSAHAHGIGSPEALAALRAVDLELGRLFDALAERGLENTLNLFITADHGFSTHTGSQSIRALLEEHALKASATSTDVVVAGGAIYVAPEFQERIPQIANRLQQTAWVGPVFSREPLPGTFPMSDIFWQHDRSADLLVSYSWSDATNEYGFAGAVTTPGVAGHGSISPFDIRTFFAMSGPLVKSNTRSRVPTGNVDIAPTVLHILGLPSAPSMDGRVLHEALKSGPAPADVLVITEEKAVRLPGRGYEQALLRSRVDGKWYVDSSRN